VRAHSISTATSSIVKIRKAKTKLTAGVASIVIRTNAKGQTRQYRLAQAFPVRTPVSFVICPWIATVIQG
jgi:hypothetical protein